MSKQNFFTVETRDGIVVISLESHLSNYQGEEFLAAIHALGSQLTSTPLDGVLVDFSQVDYFGSLVLEGLRSLWKELGGGEHRVFLCGLSDVCREIVQLAHFDHVWTIFPTREEALASIGASSNKSS